MQFEYTKMDELKAISALQKSGAIRIAGDFIDPKGTRFQKYDFRLDFARCKVYGGDIVTDIDEDTFMQALLHCMMHYKDSVIIYIGLIAHIYIGKKRRSTDDLAGMLIIHPNDPYDSVEQLVKQYMQTAIYAQKEQQVLEQVIAVSNNTHRPVKSL